MESKINEGNSLAVLVPDEGGGEGRFSLSGRITLENLNAVTTDAESLFKPFPPKKLTVDLRGLEHIDSSGALLTLQIEERARFGSVPFEFANMSSKVRNMVNLLDRKALTSSPFARKDRSGGFFEDVGETTIAFLGDVAQSITFLGTLVSEVALSILHPSTVRWNDVLLFMKKTGVDGLPILGLISFLMGLIMAFMSSLQLKQFGANMYVASLVAIAMVRELGPMITAILVAGRSGSAFAAEIGMMKVNEEVDALVTMGFNPIRFLAVPKVFAAIVVVPLLTFFADFFAIVGGMAVGVLGLNLTFHTYTEQTAWALEAFDVGSGVVKSMAFAILIAGIGCQRGFRVKGGAEAVGNAATSAVVSGMFLIIVTDSVFAVILNYIRW